MYGFLKDEKGREVFFHLGAFEPGGRKEEPVPPIPGELVEAEVDFDSAEESKAARARRVCRLQEPVPLYGTVDKYDQMSGYGFVVEHQTKDSYFLHKSEIRGGKAPLVGDEIEFYAGLREGRPRAFHVLVLGQRK
jgi:cold shock CspA family protein